jgi:hypothetical protein
MREKQQVTPGQMIQQIQRLQRIKYKYNSNLGQKLTTEEIGYDM